MLTIIFMCVDKLLPDPLDITRILIKITTNVIIFDIYVPYSKSKLHSGIKSECVVWDSDSTFRQSIVGWVYILCSVIVIWISLNHGEFIFLNARINSKLECDIILQEIPSIMP